MANLSLTFQDITPATTSTPQVGNWHYKQSVSGVPEVSVPAMLAQGWEVAGVFAVSGVRGDPLSGNAISVVEYFYSLTRTVMDNSTVVRDLLASFTAAYNEGRDTNQKRYEDIIRGWQDMMDKGQSHMDTAKALLDNKIAIHLTTLDALEAEYSSFFDDVKADLDGLAITLEADRTRVNNNFNAQISASRQNLSRRGFYSSGMSGSIEAGIEEQRELALTEVSEREKRLIAEIALRKNSVYRDVLAMRSGLIDVAMSLTNRQQEFLAYQLDTRNRLAIGLFGVVEGREDSYPGLGSMAQLTSSLGQSGATAWRSA